MRPTVSADPNSSDQNNTDSDIKPPPSIINFEIADPLMTIIYTAPTKQDPNSVVKGLE
jgi:hypothetical protein